MSHEGAERLEVNGEGSLQGQSVTQCTRDYAISSHGRWLMPRLGAGAPDDRGGTGGEK